MQFLKLGDANFLRAGLIASVAFAEDGSATVQMAAGSAPVRVAEDEAKALLRWLESNSSEIGAEDETARGVYV